MTNQPHGPEKSSASIQGAGTLCIIFLFHLHRTNSDSALHTSAMNPNPQDSFGMNQQMGRGLPQRNGESNTHTEQCTNPQNSLSLFFCALDCVLTLNNHGLLNQYLYRIHKKQSEKRLCL